jgi:hypothetical protein
VVVGTLGVGTIGAGVEGAAAFAHAATTSTIDANATVRRFIWPPSAR